MNPLRKRNCGHACEYEGISYMLVCRYEHTTGKEEPRPAYRSGKPKYYCPAEWEITAVRS